MTPTILPDDLIISTNFFKDYNHGDIVVVNNPTKYDKITKRIIVSFYFLLIK